MSVCTKERPEVLDDGKVYVYTDDADVHHYREGSPIRCGDWHNGGVEFCDKHRAELIKLYPQGWVAYPGDKCTHGTYVGGCSVDWSCWRCEA